MSENKVKTTVVDPICGMKIAPKEALSARHDGNVYYFCSKSCLQKFQSDPGRALSATQEALLPIAQPMQPASTDPCCDHASGDSPPPKRDTTFAGKSQAVYTCPMHPEVQQLGPGACPKCGMDLEPKSVSVDSSHEIAQVAAMTRRFWLAAILTMPLLLLAMGSMVGLHIDRWLGTTATGWLQWALATPVVFWCGWPLISRGLESIRTMQLNMFALIFMGSLAAYSLSVVVVAAPGVIPKSFFENGHPPIYFEAAAVIVTLVLLGQVLELRARQHTGGAIRELLKLSPSTAR